MYMNSKQIRGGSSIIELREQDSDNSSLFTQTEHNKIKTLPVVNNQTKNILTGGGYQSMLLEGLVLLFIYILMSQDVIKNFFSKYLYDVNSNNLIGTILYGIIIVGVFLLSKKLIFTNP